MYRTVFLSSLLLSGTILSSHAAPLGTVDAVETRFEEASQYRSFPSKLNFESAAGRTGAGILHYADGPDGPYILLGLRDDEESWCNFGGMSDAKEGEKKHKTKKAQLAGLLAETAAREVEEESNGYFAHHPHDVRSLPYIDTLGDRKGESFLYRMYFKKVPMVGAEHLKKAQEESVSHHNQEYKDFRWISAKSIWRAIQGGTQEVDLNGDVISLFEPLFKTLMTPAGQVLLVHVTAFSKINRFSKDLRPFLNRVYDVRSESKEDFVESDRWSLLESEKVIATELDQAQLSYAVAAHGAAMTELKSKFKVKPQKDPADEIPVFTGWNDQANLSLSQIHLRMVLGNDYKTVEDFKDTENPQRAANKANIEEYLKRYEEGNEFKRTATHTSHDIEVLADVLAFEEKNKSKPTFYHAANADLNNLWQSFTFLRELLSLTPMVGERVVMRGTDIYFKDVKIMLDILDKYGYQDYQGRQLLVLCANYVLMAGLKTTSTSSSSVEYLLNDHSVMTPNIEGKFEEATALAGIIARYSYFKSLFLQYLAHQNPEGANSVMVGISVPPELLGAHAYAAHGGGTQYGVYDGTSKPPEPTIIEVLKGIQAEDGKAAQSFEEDTERKKSLIPEARISLHPDFALHPDVKMKAFNRFPMTPTQQKEFEREMRTTTIATLADWLKSQYQVMPDSFQNYPTLKKLFAYVWKGVTGEDIQETFAYESFMHLLANGHVEGARDFLSKYPEVRTHESFDPNAILLGLIRVNKVESMKFILDEVIQKSISEFYATPKDFFMTVRASIMFENSEVLDFLLQNYDLTTVSPEVVRAWFNADEDNTIAHRFVLAKYFPEFKERARREALKTLHGSWILNNIVDYIKFTGENPSQIVRDILKTSSPQKAVLCTLLDILKLAEIDLSELTAADFDEFAKNESVSSQDEAELLLSKGLKASVFLEITVNYFANIGYNLPDWVFDFIARDDLDLKSSNANWRSYFQKSYLSNDQINTLIKAGIVSPQNVIDWLCEKNNHYDGSFMSFLEGLSSLDAVSLRARLNPAVLLENVVSFCADKDLSLPDWVFDFIARDDLDLKSSNANWRAYFQKSYLSNDQINILLRAGIVSPQNVIDWSLEKKDLDTWTFFESLRNLSSLGPVVLSADNQTQLGALLARSTYINRDDLDFLMTVGGSPLSLVKGLISALSLEGSSVNYELMHLTQTHPEVLADLEVQEVVTLLKSCDSDEVRSQILSNVKDQEALAKAIEATECKNSQEMCRLFMFAKIASLDPRKIPGFDPKIIFDESPYMYESAAEFLTQYGFEVSELFKMALTPKMLQNYCYYYYIANFARNHLDDLKSELTEDEQEALQGYRTDDFISAIKRRYQIADLPEVVVPETVVQEESVAPVETPVVESGDGVTVDVSSLPAVEGGDQMVDEVPAPTVSSIDWDSLHGDDFLKALKGMAHPTVRGFEDRIDQIKSAVESSCDSKVVQGAIDKIFALDDFDLSLVTLQKAFASVNDFRSSRSIDLNNGEGQFDPLGFVLCAHSFFSSPDIIGPFHNSLKAIIFYLGDTLPLYLQNDSQIFSSILYNLSQSDEGFLRQLWTRYPDLFTYKDEENDFFDKALDVLDGPIVEEFALHFQHKLKDLSLDGAPYIWSAWNSEGDLSDEMREYIAQNPDLFELKSIDGISLEEYLSDLLDMPEGYEKIMKKLKTKSKSRKK